MSEKTDIVWLFAAKKLARLIQNGKLASAAHVVKAGIKQGTFEDVRSWRTAALLFIPIDLKSKPKRKKFATSRWENAHE